MARQKEIEDLLQKELSPTHLEVIDESQMHSRGRETHFKVVVVSSKFSGLNKVKRQQLVYRVLQPIFDQGLHALSQSTFSPEEWAAGANVNASPVCAGGRKVEGQ